MRPDVLAGIVAVALSAVTLGAQQRPPLPAALTRYVSVDAPVVALTHVRVVDGTGAPAREDQTIVIRGERIDAVGPASSIRVPAGAQVVDLAGHTVIPGLVGLHEHTWFGGVRVSTPMSASGPLYLAMGVTTAMTAGTEFAYHELNLKRSVDTGIWPGPRFEIAGPYLNGGPPRPATGSRDRELARGHAARCRLLGERGRDVVQVPRHGNSRRACRRDQGGARARSQGHRASLLRHVQRSGRTRDRPACSTDSSRTATTCLTRNPMSARRRTCVPRRTST